MIPPFDESTGALPAGDHLATLAEIEKRFGFTPRRSRWRMWVDHGVEFFIHPAMRASPDIGFPQFFRQDRDGSPRGIIRIVRQ
jgi:hypothetical protein